MCYRAPIPHTPGGSLTTNTEEKELLREQTWYDHGKRELAILKELVSKDFKLKYRRSVLGVVWSVLNPLLMMVVMAAVFSYMMRYNADDIPSFPLYIILGNVTFSLMSDSTSQGMGSIIGASSLLKKVKITRWVFPVEKVLFAMLNFAFSLIAVAIVMVIVGIAPTLWLLMLPVFLLYMGVFCVGLSMFLSAASVFFRDVMHLWGVILTAWTYATPLFYPESILPHWMITLEKFNPMYHYVNYIRELLLYGRAPSLELNLACIACALIALVIGIIVFKRSEHKFILYI